MKFVSFFVPALCFISGALQLRAELPQPGTDETPQWYYIQVVGEDARRDRVFTVRDGSTNVYGEPIIDKADMGEVSTQLWRFIPDGQKYQIVNKATGMSLNVAYDASLDISRAVLTQNSDVRFTLEPNGEQFRIVSSKTPQGGDSSEIYLHQGNGGTRDYSVMMVSSYWSNDPNSQFHFLAFDDFEVEYSTDNHSAYYKLFSGNPAFAGKCLTYDVNADYPLVMRDEVTADARQHWSVKQAGDDKVYLVNRATGHVIRNESVRHAGFNRPQLNEESGNDAGWAMNYVGGSQYMLSAVEEDGVERMLNASAGDTPETFRADEVKNSGFGWKFRKVSDKGVTGNNQISVSDNDNVRVEDGRVIAPEGVEYRVFSISGHRVPAGERLQSGVYVIEAAGKANKVIVQ